MRFGRVVFDIQISGILCIWQAMWVTIFMANLNLSFIDGFEIEASKVSNCFLESILKVRRRWTVVSRYAYSIFFYGYIATVQLRLIKKVSFEH